MEKKIDEKLKDLLNSRKQKKVSEKPQEEKKSLLIKNINKEIFQITGDDEVNSFLKEKSLEVLNLQARTSLTLGKIFSEVELRLAGNRYTGCYVKWLEFNGFNKMTALRHRNRYKLYTLCEDDFSKEVVAKLPYRQINDICKNENPQSIIRTIERERSIDILDNMTLDRISFQEKNEIIDFDFNNFLTHLPKKETLEKLPIDKQKTLLGLFKKIDKILNEI